MFPTYTIPSSRSPSRLVGSDARLLEQSLEAEVYGGFLCGEVVEVGRLSHYLWDFQETSPGFLFLELNMNFN